MVYIGNKTIISTHVTFVTHDNSIITVLPEKSNIFEKIIIRDNVFVGQGSIIMYGVELVSNKIVAAGSVVTKSITEQGKIIGGNPAKVISDIESFSKKGEKFGMTRSLLKKE